MLEVLTIDNNDKIKVLFTTARLIRYIPDDILLWKLDLEYLDLLCEYMHILSHDDLLCNKFLDAGIDTTKATPGCLGTKNFYPLLKI